MLYNQVSFKLYTPAHAFAVAIIGTVAAVEFVYDEYEHAHTDYGDVTKSIITHTLKHSLSIYPRLLKFQIILYPLN